MSGAHLDANMLLTNLISFLTFDQNIEKEINENVFVFTKLRVKRTFIHVWT
jgi:hypothetical protein